jgi:hypothetical protein
MVQPALDAALAIAETYCDRFFMEADEVETIIPVNGNTLKVHRYPITSVASITEVHGTGTFSASHIDKKAGVVYMDSHGWSHEATITYKGGYATLPLDIELALFDIFMAVWNATPGAGAAVGGAVTVSGTGAIRSISVPDSGTIQYFDPATTASSSGAVGAGASRFLGADAINLLAPYRRIDA